MPKISGNDINIEYEIHGSGDPLLLVAGLGYDRWMWHKTVPLLAEHFQVITFDNRGVGGTDAPKGPYTVQLLADDTAALLSELGIEKTAVMGHSMGGFVAQALALHHPQLVSNLVLSATNFGGPNHIRITREALLVLMDSRGDPIERLRRGIVVSTAAGYAEREPEFIEEWIAYRAAHPITPAAYEAQLAIGLGLMSEEAAFENKLHTINVPTLILFGEEDKVVPPGNAELFAARLPDNEIAILPGVGHFFPFEAPETAASAVTRFLQKM
jgi:pimeloyl-ACP methyl ester carboxylesterase